MAMQKHYPTYDVLEQMDHWDDHTQKIVQKRLEPLHQLRFFRPEQMTLLMELAARITGDPRPEIGQYIVKHLDQSLAKDVGEGERHVNSPPQAQLIREGLNALEQSTVAHLLAPFAGLQPEQQRSILTMIQGGMTPYPQYWEHVDPTIFMKKLVQLVIEAYYSHPHVWSDIGYGGPAYPRGYVRTELGQLDPWEAKRKHAEEKIRE